VLPGLAPALADRREPLAPLLVELLERLQGCVGVGRGVDRPQVTGDLFALPPGDVAEAVADQMDDAGLDPGVGEDRLDRLGEPL
jgi:hypothetical protein